MAKLIAAIDVSTIDPTQGGAQNFPIGQHKVVMTKAEVKATKGGDGGMVVFEGEIIEGPATGQKGALRFNLYNQNQQTVEIAVRQFSAFAHVVGRVGVITDTDVLLNIPFQIEVGLQRAKTEEEAKKGYTEIKRFFDYNGNEPGQNGGGQQQQSNNGFGGGQQQPQNNQQQQPPQNNAGQQNGFPVNNNVQMPPQNNQQPPQQNAPAGGWNGAGAGGGQQANPPAGNGAAWGAGANGGGNAAPGGWGQQRA